MTENSTNKTFLEPPKEEEEEKQPDEWQIAFSSLPLQVQNWICSMEVTNNNKEIAKKFNLPPTKNQILAYLTSQAILKKIPVDSLIYDLQQNLEIDEITARQMTLEIIFRQFLPIKNHFPRLEDIVKKLGGVLQEEISPMTTSLSSQSSQPSEKNLPKKEDLRKTFRQAVKDNKEILNQLLTSFPLKIAGVEQPVRPTIKNWLADYIKQKGAGYHGTLERNEFLFKNENFKQLTEKEKIKVMTILRAYDDEKITLPIIPENQLLDTEKISRSDIEFGQINQQQITKSLELNDISKEEKNPDQKIKEKIQDKYRESIPPENLPRYPHLGDKKNLPKISGNVIDLSSLGKEEN